MIGNELKAYDGLTSRQQLNLFRNLYYNDGNATEYGIIANAINDYFTADVVEVVRCKDCKYARGNLISVGICDCMKYRDIRNGGDFCNYGKRRE